MGSGEGGSGLVLVFRLEFWVAVYHLLYRSVKKTMTAYHMQINFHM